MPSNVYKDKRTEEPLQFGDSVLAFCPGHSTSPPHDLEPPHHHQQQYSPNHQNPHHNIGTSRSSSATLLEQHVQHLQHISTTTSSDHLHHQQHHHQHLFDEPAPQPHMYHGTTPAPHHLHHPGSTGAFGTNEPSATSPVQSEPNAAVGAQHPLFEHGACKWPGCEEHLDKLAAFIG